MSEIILTTPDQLRNIVSSAVENAFRNAQGNPEQQKREEMIDKYLNQEEAAKFLGLSVTTVWKFCKAGRLKPVRIGRRKLFRKSDLLQL